MNCLTRNGSSFPASGVFEIDTDLRSWWKRSVISAFVSAHSFARARSSSNSPGCDGRRPPLTVPDQTACNLFLLCSLRRTQGRVKGNADMHQKRAESLFKPIKQSSVRPEGARSDALEEYRAEQAAVRERMAVQRANRLRASDQPRAKNRST